MSDPSGMTSLWEKQGTFSGPATRRILRPPSRPTSRAIYSRIWMAADRTSAISRRPAIRGTWSASAPATCIRNWQNRKEHILKVSIFGLGYVGAVSAGCFANDGHEVIGVDPVQTKVDLVNQGHSPIIEADIGEIISSTIKAGRLRATSDS